MRSHGVVITGMGALTPLGSDVASLWEGALAGRSGVRRIDEFLGGHDELPVRIGAPMAADPATFLERVQARRMDRCTQAALVAARQAWQDAGAPEVDRDRLAAVIGTGIGGATTLLGQEHVLMDGGPRKVSPLSVPMLMPNAAAAQVSIEFGARAGSYTTASACASGADAIAQAVRLIRLGEADIVIAGGAETPILPMTIAGFSQARTLSKRNDEPERASRPFDAARDGFVLGEGAGALIIESEEHAAARGARVLGRIAGIGVTADAYHITGPDPTGNGQVRAIRRALDDAGLTPADVAHVNAHSTSTVVGDPGEATAIQQALGDHVVLTAPKSAIGHLVGAAGAVEGILTMLSLRDNVVPPTLNLENQDPDVKLDVVSGRPREITLHAAISNSFGFGGQNVSILFTKV
ncbi:beta-ketoacyl-ACP synthase II [Actinoplanes sp. TBRC 11911]|uniref:beta-ketoacyl-ACP synthase II n=1 Tax=Actinoplanes sp. TBRC 11911 TaxID=2729386 RepID=UPI00145E9421|nr:beta-ketoacyl-ACP synthase II [Actinoplanes sp. TBRC 11911]NMO51775.1 beta-ketoacyl-ACP synthase II [Actinoplanes sp. TBRC 11911]